MAEPAAATNRKRINLALQGGGAHGAFTWGVLDRLLEDGRVAVDGITGTSAGAMNAVALAYGLMLDGEAGGGRVLRRFWETIAERARWSLLQPSPLDRLLGVPGKMDFSPGWQLFDAATRLFSPYQLNPFGWNPLREVLEEVVRFDELRAHNAIRLFICATNVKTGRIKVFHCDEVTADAVLASACLPYMYHAVEIDGQAYWDGGFMGNPPLYPLFYETETEDVLIVQINPINIEAVPTSAIEILDRMNELSFNSSLMREMRTVAFVKKLLREQRVPEGRYKDIKVHMIGAEAEMAPLGFSSKLNADREFLGWLFELGRGKADRFLAEHFDKIGVESSTDIDATFL
jgi:NTE family protein